MNNTYDYIYKLINNYNYNCNNSNYLKTYGIHIFFTIIYLIIIIYTIVYLKIKLNINNIRKNWVNYRCNPAYIPFAGFINKPNDMSTFEYTKQNFDFCTMRILESVSNDFTNPISYLQNLIFLILKSISESLNLMRKMFNSIRDNVSNITKNIMARIMNIIIPYIAMILNIRDLISKINGVFTTSIYTFYSMFLSLASILKMIKSILITIVVTVIIVFILLAIAIGWFVPPLLASLPAFIAMGALISTVVASISVLLFESFRVISTSSVPKLPSYCFDKNTILIMKDNTRKYIKNIKLGDILHDNSIVESIMISNSKKSIMYKLNNIIVSNKHKIFYKEYGWINIEDHPFSVKIENYNEPLIYCLSTNTKIININNNIFTDWDELDDNDINILKEKFDYINDYREINKLNSGIHPDTELLLDNNKKIKIKDINIGDILYQNNEVLSIIKIKSDKLDFSEFIFKNNKFSIKACSNIVFNNYNNIVKKTINPPNICYNLITSNGIIIIGNLEIKDYINSGIEYYL